MADSRNADLLMLEDLLDGLREVQEDPAMQQATIAFGELSTQIREALEQGTVDVVSVKDFLNNNPDLVGAAKIGMGKHALKFVEAEMKKLQKIKGDRPLTDQEIAKARKTLVPIIDNLDRWFPE